MISLESRRRFLIGGIGLFTFAVGATLAWQQLREPVCAPGYELNDPVNIALRHRGSLSAEQMKTLREQFGAQACFNKALDRMMEVRDRREAREEFFGFLPREVRQFRLPDLIRQKEILRGNQPKVANASGKWTPYGKGGLVGDAEFPGGIATLGINDAAGLTADLEYDSENKRLFAAVSAGGIWMSEAAGGDLSTLAASWTDIGRTLPTQSVAHVSWTSAGGGTLLALTGEHTIDGGSFSSLGVYWTTDFGKKWTQATGMEGVIGGLAFHMAVDAGNPEIVYAATGRGLYRSTDAGRSFINVALPTADCAGVTAVNSSCFLANVVTDVVVQAPGGGGRAVACGGGTPCPVLAAIGWPEGAKLYKDGVTPQSPMNGLYKSATGEPGTFAKLDLLPVAPPAALPAGVIPVGFAPQNQIGRVELAAAYGPNQDHNFVYAIVDDALLERGGLPVLDIDDLGANTVCNMLVPPGTDPSGLNLGCPTVQAVTHATAFNGIYVSPDFGDTWVRLADEIEVSLNPTAGSALNPAYIALAGYGPGVQASYNMFIAVDPTASALLPEGMLPDAPAGVPVPTRISFGLEEVWMNRLPVPLAGVPGTVTGPASDYEVIGEYFAGDSCYGLSLAPPLCPQQPTAIMNGNTTTHPDQHDAVFVPDGAGGVYLFIANDGGIWKQHSTGPTDPFDNNSWGNAVTNGMNTLLIYGMGVSGDGTVYIGLQDNGSAKIEPSEDGNGGRIVSTGGGDGVYSTVDPTDSEVAYQQTPGLSLEITFDGGRSFSDISPPAGTPHFTSPYMLDTADPSHVAAAGSKVAVATDGAFSARSWTQVFDLGVDEQSATPHQSRLRAIDVHDGAIYVGWCGPCVPSLLAVQGEFQRGLATNVTAAGKPAVKGTDAGWHQASLNGLPNRYLHAVEIDPKNAKTVYVGLGNYSTARYLPAGAFLDNNTNIGKGRIFKSTDAGENFKDITGKLPDTIVTSLLVVGNQLIAGTDLGAFISSDLDGGDWALMGDLPPIAVNQLVQDPADAKRVFAATYGRGVWTYKLTEDGTPKPVTPVLPAAPTEKPEGGFLIGAFSPGLLWLLGLGFVLRRRRH